jgi:hypothetical protein
MHELSGKVIDAIEKCHVPQQSVPASNSNPEFSYSATWDLINM